MLSYLVASSFCLARSGAWASFRFRLNFLRSAEVEKLNSLSDCFSAGLGGTSVFGVTEKLGARGPLGFAGTGFRFSSVMKLGLI